VNGTFKCQVDLECYGGHSPSKNLQLVRALTMAAWHKDRADQSRHALAPSCNPDPLVMDHPGLASLSYANQLTALLCVMRAAKVTSGRAAR
jgi:hypothetical protein